MIISARPKKTALAPGALMPSACVARISPSPSGTRIKAPRMGPKRVPMPPMMGASMMSMERDISKIWAEKTLL